MKGESITDVHSPRPEARAGEAGGSGLTPALVGGHGRPLVEEVGNHLLCGQGRGEEDQWARGRCAPRDRHIQQYYA